MLNASTQHSAAYLLAHLLAQGSSVFSLVHHGQRHLLALPIPTPAYLLAQGSSVFSLVGSGIFWR